MVAYSTETQVSLDFIEDDEYKHWCPASETYATADVLLQYLRAGWELDNLVAVETFYHAGYRCSDIYCFTLMRNGESREIPILANPVVFRVIDDHQLTILRINVSPISI